MTTLRHADTCDCGDPTHCGSLLTAGGTCACTTPVGDPASPCGYIYRWHVPPTPGSLPCAWSFAEHGSDGGAQPSHTFRPTRCLACGHRVEVGE